MVAMSVSAGGVEFKCWAILCENVDGGVCMYCRYNV